ncbi:alkaline phosphatase family protein [Amycolatopsis saalfeldensis]|uniref:Phosphoesterase family protein n=1 Tax=Amycolatopsis saalfeldensis TaxID=394193 RepID=A0A1H8YCW1_9PSEU|nr:alkaline phosphatase family protein [Amycolatopsis saalfeldensis]SEP49308.1 Phosphoesterase family protein [Amycolatopsis saalfeldensis]
MNGLTHRPEGQFEYDARNDKLPTVSWIICTSTASEHPDYTPAEGAAFVASKIDAIASNPEVWAKTAFILNYDENEACSTTSSRRSRRRARRTSSRP